ncbi:hypothetical protein A5678_04385 [Mycobacterium sp. E2733]|nr:hypothetical protein [Mycobacterium sp. E2733]OBH94272.1 hypothetical protein A5678_04385 [Mycobacterium sp. E2733]
MAPETVRIVLVEGEAAGGVTVDQDDFRLADQTTAVAAADRVVAAILGTRESAAQGGYRLKSSGVTWTDPGEAAALRNALAARKIEDVMLVSAVMAAAALAQAAGSATNCARTALLLVEPNTATMAVVDTADGSVADVRRRPLPSSDEAALAELAAMASGAESMKARPDGLFLVGSDVDIPYIKPALEAATSLSVTTPEEPEMALARGASLAAANAQLGAPSTIAMPYAGDLSADGRELAYSAESNTGKSRTTGADGEAAAHSGARRSRKSVLAVAAATLIFIGGVVALAVALAVDIRPHANQHPDINQNVVAPSHPAPPPRRGLP